MRVVRVTSGIEGLLVDLKLGGRPESGAHRTEADMGGRVVGHRVGRWQRTDCAM